MKKEIFLEGPPHSLKTIVKTLTMMHRGLKNFSWPVDSTFISIMFAQPKSELTLGGAKFFAPNDAYTHSVS